MKNKTAGKILFAVFAVALCVAAYFAADLAFFQYDDPVTENVTRVAKTDMEYTQGYDSTANSFLSDEIPFEVVYKDRESFAVYYNSQPLKNTDITVTLSDGAQKTFTTDENGEITGLNLNDVRSSLSFTYYPDTMNTYSINYQVEADTIFTTRWLSAMLPFGKCSLTDKYLSSAMALFIPSSVKKLNNDC